MRYTLLEMTQRILESMESDEISDINETPESLAVANIIKECYFDIVGEFNPMEVEGLFKLDASGNSSLPTLMYIPTSISKILWLQYNISDADKPNYQELQYIRPEEFFYETSGIDPDDTTYDDMTVTINGTAFVFRYKNDKFPQKYTIFDDYYVIFDSYDVGTELTLTQARTLGFGDRVPTFTMSNTFTPDLDPRQFQLLLQDSKRTAFEELKQASHKIATEKTRKNRIIGQKIKADNDPASTNQARVGFGRRSGPMTSIKRAMRNGS